MALPCVDDRLYRDALRSDRIQAVRLIGMDAIEVRFGRAIRAQREKLGLSQEAFAIHAGIHRTYVSSVELGKVQVSIRIAEQLAAGMGMPLSKLWRHSERDADRA